MDLLPDLQGLLKRGQRVGILVLVVVFFPDRMMTICNVGMGFAKLECED